MGVYADGQDMSYMMFLHIFLWLLKRLKYNDADARFPRPKFLIPWGVDHIYGMMLFLNIWRFPKWGLPLVIIHVRLGFYMINHQF